MNCYKHCFLPKWWKEKWSQNGLKHTMPIYWMGFCTFFHFIALRLTLANTNGRFNFEASDTSQKESLFERITIKKILGCETTCMILFRCSHLIQCPCNVGILAMNILSTVRSVRMYRLMEGLSCTPISCAKTKNLMNLGRQRSQLDRNNDNGT